MDHKFIIYYGMEVPPFEQTTKVNDSFVILQNYHPIVHQGAFKEYFPKGNRYLYFNCCKVPRIECELPLEDLIHAQYQAEWDCFILDTDIESHANLLIQRALALTEIQGVQGLFIDDLDVYTDTPHRQNKFIRFLDKLDQKLPQEMGFIFNRGFPFWTKKINRLKAIIIENVGPNTYLNQDNQVQAWIDLILNIHMPLIQEYAPHVPIAFLEYAEDVKNTQDPDLESIKIQNFDKFSKNSSLTFLLKKQRELNLWPEHWAPKDSSGTSLMS